MIQQTELYCCFHLNMAFSAIEESARTIVINRCYWPLLRLAQNGFPIAIEATGYTLDVIADLDSMWITEAKKLIAEGKLEFIASGHAQIIAPLAPAELNRQNLLIGLHDYERHFGVRPKLALINEQAFSSGLIDIYRSCGFDAIMTDWADAHSHNLAWPMAYLGAPQKLLSDQGEDIGLLWSDAIAFQKFQRLAHGEITQSEFDAFLAERLQDAPATLPLYTSDAEVFDYRPGRFEAEAALGKNGEWQLIEAIFTGLASRDDVRLVFPSEALNSEALNSEALNSEALNITAKKKQAPIKLTNLDAPVTVKKQRKYNLNRWAVTGRADLRLNTHCWRLFDAKQAGKSDISWRELCELWASDYRTHITSARWQDLLETLPATAPITQDPQQNSDTQQTPSQIHQSWQDHYLILQADSCYLVLNSFRGLAVQAFDFGTLPEGLLTGVPAPGLIGTLAHGYFKDIRLGADFYTGHLVMEPNDRSKIADLGRSEPTITLDNGVAHISTSLKTALGEIAKTIIFDPANQRIETAYDIGFPFPDRASVRLGHVKINPNRFDPQHLFVRTHNGGAEETFYLRDRGLKSPVDHGAPVSRLISASTGFGMTEGQITIGDTNHEVILHMARSHCAALAHFSYQPVVNSYFCRLALSLQESDETSRPLADQQVDLMQKLALPHMRYSITLKRMRQRL